MAAKSPHPNAKVVFLNSFVRKGSSGSSSQNHPWPEFQGWCASYQSAPMFVSKPVDSYIVHEDEFTVAFTRTDTWKDTIAGANL